MTYLVRRTLLHAPGAAARATTLAVLPAGGQQRARRNAWAAMSADAARTRSRREAESALALAIARAASSPVAGAPADAPPASAVRVIGG